ncbi:MAG: hypothetical protein GY730_10595 [bacterium]|nr:hypothetical protein [bacterium]
MKKIDLKKEYKKLFSASYKDAAVIDVPKVNYLSISGKGDPNTTSAYREAIETLFSLSYSIKFIIKKGSQAIDYGVLPLESLWWVENMKDFDINDKSNWLWKTMIMQPDFINDEIMKTAATQVQKKKNLPQLTNIKFEQLSEGLCAQILHKGPYSEEGPTIKKLHQFINENGYQFNGHHHEVYLSDPSRSAPEKLKTIIRQPVKK